LCAQLTCDLFAVAKFLFIRNTVKLGRSLTNVVSPGKIQYDHPLP